MSKRKTPKAWVAYKVAKIGERLGSVQAIGAHQPTT
jgi:hypothetical protein